MGVSLTELSVIFLVALLLFGPEQLPALAKTVGRLSGQLKRTSDSLRKDLYNSLYPPIEGDKGLLDGELRALRSLKSEIFSPPQGSIGTASKPSSNINGESMTDTSGLKQGDQGPKE